MSIIVNEFKYLLKELRVLYKNLHKDPRERRTEVK